MTAHTSDTDSNVGETLNLFRGVGLGSRMNFQQREAVSLGWTLSERERESLSRGRKRNLNYYLQPYYCSLRKAQNDHMIALYQIKTPISRCKILSKLAVGEQAQIHSSVLARTFALRYESLIAEISKSIERSDVKLGIQTCCYYIFQLTRAVMKILMISKYAVP